jgi:hypothetical protein
MKHIFKVGDLVIASVPSGEYIGRVVSIRSGIGADYQLLSVLSPLSGEEKSFAGGWCKLITPEGLAKMETQELALVMHKYDILKRE